MRLSGAGADGASLGYRIDAREYAGPAPDLTPDELATLHLAANIVKVEGLPTESAFWKFGGAPRRLAEGEPMVAIPAEAALGPLFRAVSERRLAQFVYNGEDRVVEPLRLLFSRGHWYLSGWDRGRDDD